MLSFQITLTAAQLAKLLQKIKALPDYTDAMLTEGTLPETKGVKLAYTVSRNAQGGATLNFSVLKRPIIGAPVGLIQTQVQKMIDEA